MAHRGVNYVKCGDLGKAGALHTHLQIDQGLSTINGHSDLVVPNGQKNPKGNLDCGHTLGAALIHLSGEGDVKSFFVIPHLRYVLEVEQPTKTLIIVHFPQNVYINISWP